MNKYAPLIGLSLAGLYLFQASSSLSVSPTAPPPPASADFSEVGRQFTAPTKAIPEPRPAPARGGSGRGEPAYKSMVRCLNDLDDLLDTIKGPGSFAAVKPKLLDRVRQQAALAAEHPNQGGSQLSRAASLEVQKATNRHTKALIRANTVAPGVTDFFAKEVAAVLNVK